MSRMIIHNARLVMGGCIERGGLVVGDGRVSALLPPGATPAADEVIDAGGALLAPGFIDLHIHGSGPHLVDHGPAALAELSRLLSQYGVTGFLPTVCPRPAGEDSRFLAMLAGVRFEGAAALGFHLEGPFLSLTGALPPAALGQADLPRLRALQAAARPYRAIFSISPEFPGVAPLVAAMAEGGTPVFMTHTAADVAQTQAAIAASARHAPHFYDVFPVPRERDPGVRPCGAVKAVLADEHTTVDFILDGEHVDPVAVRMALRCKGADGVCLITDANVGAGLPPGRYAWAGGEEIEFARPGGPARLTAQSRTPGGLAGSGLTMDQALRNAVAMLGVDLPAAVAMVSANPASVLGLGGRKGSLAVGGDADLVLLGDDLRVLRTWVGGRTVFEKV